MLLFKRTLVACVQLLSINLPHLVLPDYLLYFLRLFGSEIKATAQLSVSNGLRSFDLRVVLLLCGQWLEVKVYNINLSLQREAR